MSPLWVSYRSMTSRSPPFTFVELVSPYNKKNITRWLEDMNFMFSFTREILFFLSLGHKIHIFSPPCNILYISSSREIKNTTTKTNNQKPLWIVFSLLYIFTPLFSINQFVKTWHISSPLYRKLSKELISFHILCHYSSTNELLCSSYIA